MRGSYIVAVIWGQIYWAAIQGGDLVSNKGAVIRGQIYEEDKRGSYTGWIYRGSYTWPLYRGSYTGEELCGKIYGGRYTAKP